LFDDYFSRPVLKNKYFTLNNAPPGLSIDTVIYLNASQATIMLSGNLNNPVELSVSMKAKILNSFKDLTSDELSVSVDSKPIIQSRVLLYTTSNAIHLKCNTPELLGDEIEIFNLSGQLIMRAKIDQIPINIIGIEMRPGIYFCRFQLDGRKQTVRVSNPFN